MSTGFRAITETGGTRADADQMAMSELRHSLVAALAEGRDLIDVACGSGYALPLIARRARSVVACDYDEVNVREARAALPSATVRVADAEDLPFEPASFDVVACLEAIYYFQDWRRFLSTAFRMLRDGGDLVITWPNPARPSFNRSPKSTEYPSVDEILAEAAARGFTATCYGGFPLQSLSTAGRPWLDRLRRVVVAMHLIPRSLRLRMLLKRMLYRRLRPLSEVSLMEGPFARLTEIRPGEPAPYAMLYFVGRKVAGAA